MANKGRQISTHAVEKLTFHRGCPREVPLTNVNYFSRPTTIKLPFRSRSAS